MPFPRPTLTQLQESIEQDYATSGIDGLDAMLPVGVVPTMTWVQAQMANLQYGYLDYIARQAVPWTAVDEALAGWAALKGITRKPATAATGMWASSGTAGRLISSGTTVARADGTTYASTADYTIPTGGVIALPITATTNAAAGNASAGVTLTLQTPISGVTTAGTAQTALTGGADVETNASLRSRMLLAYQTPGQNGSAADYVNWALAVPGVTRAWVVRNGLGVPSVLIYFMMDDAEAANGGFPQGTNGTAASETRATAATGDQLAVANAIWSKQAVEALVWLAAPAQYAVDFTITGLGTSNTSANQTAITAALTDMFLRLGAPGGTIQPSAWESAIVAIPGVSQFTVASPAASVTATAGSLPILGTVTFAS